MIGDTLLDELAVVALGLSLLNRGCLLLPAGLGFGKTLARLSGSLLIVR